MATVTLPSAAPAPAVKPLTCPNCGGTIELRAAGYTVTAVCSYCSSVVDVANPDARIIAAYNQAAAELQIPLGTRGTLDGNEWEAIGYLMRSENGAYPWEEYLLFNPYLGYRWLITDGRGWSLGEQLVATPDVASGGMRIGGEVYEPFFALGRAQVGYVLGEFYWRVERGEEVETADYVRPGAMLSWERNASEQSWTLSNLLDPGQVSAAFRVGPPPKSSPPLPHQPSPHARTLRSFGKAAAATLVVLFLVMFLFAGNPVLLKREVTIRTDGQDQSITLGPIALTRAYQALTVRAEAPGLDNAWVEFGYGLVDRRSGTAYEAADIAESYSGSDADGPWREGSGSGSVKFAGIPRGEYDLVVNLSGNNWAGAQANSATSIFGTAPSAVSPSDQIVRVIVFRSGVFLSNFLLAAFLILLPLLFVLMRHMSFETSRKAQSDFAPAGDDDDGDDD